MFKPKYCSILILFIVLLGSSCTRTEETDTDKQLVAFLKKNNINAVKDASGLYYQIIKPGSGSFTYPDNTQITIKYEGKLLNGEMFDDGGGQEQTFPLASLIKGWKIGIPKIQKGGEIRLIIPPSLGYGGNGAGSVPPNAVLDFNIKLSNTQ
ncbi:peptidylprolyl isomerase [Pedobacter changchengzhani]|uniref:Peptidyl-prolyl cis-trans isomerase n=1 Tax=Pedobacter changchengzhani TaxID=2529274 RepID=A0A4V2ZZZ4_9SPHI|nr:FKBP-type peptidyl-prolyl cis-trans isomerase [Pedobacter changchengzhani]TDG35403.1 peptidylprolyl isomerase [Pedobacter changchengzhani]